MQSVSRVVTRRHAQGHPAGTGNADRADSQRPTRGAPGQRFEGTLTALTAGRCRSSNRCARWTLRRCGSRLAAARRGGTDRAADSRRPSLLRGTIAAVAPLVTMQTELHTLIDGGCGERGDGAGSAPRGRRSADGSRTYRLHFCSASPPVSRIMLSKGRSGPGPRMFRSLTGASAVALGLRTVRVTVVARESPGTFS